MSQFCESLHCPASIGCVCNGERNLSTVFPRYSALFHLAHPGVSQGRSNMTTCRPCTLTSSAIRGRFRFRTHVMHGSSVSSDHGCAYGLAPIDPSCCSHRLFAVTHCGHQRAGLRLSTGRMNRPHLPAAGDLSSGGAHAGSNFKFNGAFLSD